MPLQADGVRLREPCPDFVVHLFRSLQSEGMQHVQAGVDLDPVEPWRGELAGQHDMSVQPVPPGGGTVPDTDLLLRKA